jgi:hypothetical protein
MKMNSRFDRPGMERTKYATKTVLVEAITKPPTPGFRHLGKAIGFGEQIRVPLDLALDLQRRGKARVIEGTEETVLM